MTAPTPDAAVVIPTYNRRASLARTLDALDRQTFDPARFEVVIVVNACDDDTVEYVQSRQWRFTLRVIERSQRGAAAARNAGAQATVAPLLIFLDDDVEPCPQLVEAHVFVHGAPGHGESAPLRVAIGYLPAVLQPEGDLFAITLRAWWEAMFDRMREAGHRFAYTDLLSGNFSVSRRAFLQLGGFDARYGCHEDYELGYRLITAGAAFVFVERAAAVHTDCTRVDRACARKREEGYADAQLARQYPELRTALPIARTLTVKQRALRWIAFHLPRFGDAAMAALVRTLPPLERIGTRLLWLRTLYAVFGYWYARGLADALETRAELRRLLADAWADPRLCDRSFVVDLEAGLGAAEGCIETARPSAVTLALAGREFGHIPYLPGAERLGARHLRHALGELWHRQYAEALIATRRLSLFAPADTDGTHERRRGTDANPDLSLLSSSRACSDASSA